MIDFTEMFAGCTKLQQIPPGIDVILNEVLCWVYNIEGVLFKVYKYQGVILKGQMIDKKHLVTVRELRADEVVEIKQVHPEHFL